MREQRRGKESEHVGRTRKKGYGTRRLRDRPSVIVTYKITGCARACACAAVVWCTRLGRKRATQIGQDGSVLSGIRQQRQGRLLNERIIPE